jgi:tetratricopeptide (TPR) repeat protein
MRRKILFMCLCFIAMFLAHFPSPAQSSSSQDTLNQYIADLQKNPDDNALREKIIKLAQEIKPVPAVPEDADRFMARGTAAVKSAKNGDDFKDAVAEFEKATLAAPWLANAYYNLGVAQDKAGQYASAIKSLKLYLLAEPNASDTKAVKTLIYEIEYRQEKVATQSSPEAAAAQEQKKSEDWLKKLDGRRYTMPFSDGTMVIDVRGNVLVKGVIDGGGAYKELTGEDARVGILSHETIVHLHPSQLNFMAEETYIISEDGDKITERARYTDGNVREYIFLWQR